MLLLSLIILNLIFKLLKVILRFLLKSKHLRLIVLRLTKINRIDISYWTPLHPLENAPSYALAVTHGLRIPRYMGVHVLVCTPWRRQKRRGGALFSCELAYELEAGRERDLWEEVGSDPIRVSRSRRTNTFRSIDRCVHLMDY